MIFCTKLHLDEPKNVPSIFLKNSRTNLEILCQQGTNLLAISHEIGRKTEMGIGKKEFLAEFENFPP